MVVSQSTISVLITHLSYLFILPTYGKEYRLGMLGPSKHIRLGWDVNAAAATMALHKAEMDGLLNGNTVKLIYKNDNCKPKEGSGQAVILKTTENVDGFIGPPCSASALTVAYLASFWNSPMFTQAASDPALSNKAVFTTLVRMGAPFIRLGPAMGEIFAYFHWKQFVMLSWRREGSRYVFCDYSARAIEEYFRGSDVKLSEWMQFDRGPTDSEIDEQLNRAKQRGRIIVFCADIKDEHRYYLRAKTLKMMDGNYLFITLSYIPPSYITTPWSAGTPDSSNPDLKGLYKNVIQVSLASLTGPKADAFLKEIPQKMSEAPWYYTGTLESGKTGSVYALALHDIMYLYCIALNKTLEQGGDPSNGTQMFNNAKNVTFNGITGPVTMDNNADKLPNYWLWHMNQDDTTFQVWTEIHMNLPKGKRFNISLPSTWNTADGSVPRDIPLCGFLNELCPPYDLQMILIVTITCVTITVICMVLLILVARWKKQQQDLEKMLWKLKYEELHFTKMLKRFGSMSSINTIRNSNYNLHDISSNNALDIASTNTAPLTAGRDYAIYKGVTVVAQHIKIQSLTLTHSEKVELNAMRQMNHENLNQFMGMCIEPSDIYIVSSYCSRGSLQDILATDEIKLDMVFKKSLLHDLVAGTLFIHNSVLKSHGHLTSDNCLIDNHWVLKIANFGIQRLRGQRDQQEYGQYQMYRDLLWTAPEILRQSDYESSLNGTKEADVYSVGIIIQEVMYRCMPYGNDMHPKDIIEQVKDVKEKVFRPNLSSLKNENDGTSPDTEDINLMMICWDELPSNRPKIATVKKIISQSQKGRSVIDNMLAMMEKYANNLEEIVETRTGELIEEKKKTDLLLYSMLPRQVADELKIGKNIEPEVFEAVTIFFSDIVGFTQLSSESTPIQVIHLLNDLYTLFDAIIQQYDVYKVETIGDAYMIVSGLPKRNGDKHASEIANTALDLLNAVSTKFKVAHKPDHRLMLRIGIHTGSCAAGVVGLTMPRYCLFGDTVNTSSRMESNGEALKIHISENCHNLLENIGGFTMCKRGEIELKGKGKQTTYWLEGKCS